MPRRPVEVAEFAQADDHDPRHLDKLFAHETVHDIWEPTQELRELQVELSEQLSPRQEEILKQWIKNGIRFDTAHWMHSLAAHFKDRSTVTPTGCITALFIDTYNRADDVLDSFRSDFESESGAVTTEKIRSVPIMKLDEGGYATVGEFIDITTRLIKTSGAYSGKEVEQLTQGIQQFLKQSTKALETYETSPSTVGVDYGEKEAVQLREQTLFPLVTMACKLYGTVRYGHGILLGSAKALEQEMRALAMAAQVMDDCNDIQEDLENNNTNIALGVFADTFQAFDEKQSFFDVPEDVRHFANQQLQAMYTHYYDQLDVQVQKHMPKPYTILAYI